MSRSHEMLNWSEEAIFLKFIDLDLVEHDSFIAHNQVKAILIKQIPLLINVVGDLGLVKGDFFIVEGLR